MKNLPAGVVSALTESRTVSVSIRKSPATVYGYLADPAHLPQWSAFITHIRRDGMAWLAITPQGPVRISFSPPNPYGILDHHVTVSPKPTVYVPMRVLKNNDNGSEVIFTVFRLPETTAEQFQADIDSVPADLANLKRVLEMT